MKKVLVDSNVILDIFSDDPRWADWAESTLEKYSRDANLLINAIIYSEVSIGFERIEELELAVARAGFQLAEIPKEALFLAGKAFLKYKKKEGTKRTTLPDFFIGAHAAVLDIELITRDTKRFRTYFPTVRLIAP